LDGKACTPSWWPCPSAMSACRGLMTARFGWRGERPGPRRRVPNANRGRSSRPVAEVLPATLAIEAVMAEKAAEFQAVRGRAPTVRARRHPPSGMAGNTAEESSPLPLRDDHRMVGTGPALGGRRPHVLGSQPGRSLRPTGSARRRPVRRHALRRRPGRPFRPFGEVSSLPRPTFMPTWSASCTVSFSHRRAHQGVRTRRRCALAWREAVPARAGPRAGRLPCSDGTNQFAPATTWQYSTAELLEAEARLLDAGRDRSGPVSLRDGGPGLQAAVAGPGLRHGRRPGRGGGANCHLGRVCDLFGWPAGTGKVRPWWDCWRPGSRAWTGNVKGLAPSAAAAANLGSELGIATRTRPSGWPRSTGKPLGWPKPAGYGPERASCRPKLAKRS